MVPFELLVSLFFFLVCLVYYYYFFNGRILNNNLEGVLKQIQAFLTLNNGYILKSYILDKVF